MEWLVNEQTLSDGSKVYDAIAYDGLCRVTLNCVDKNRADFIASTLNNNNFVVGASVAVFKLENK